MLNEYMIKLPSFLVVKVEPNKTALYCNCLWVCNVAESKNKEESKKYPNKIMYLCNQ